LRPSFPADQGARGGVAAGTAPIRTGVRVDASIQVSVRERATTATAPEVRIRKRRIVERPRLFALLDESKARVRMLVAPAGYGKTTLAEQWVARDSRRAAWFTARSSSTDVAALALGVARSATKIVEECDVRLRAHMRALPAAAENVETLAEILGEDLGEWPSDTWLVIDDYHEVAQEPRAEDFVQALVANSSAQFVLASRVRPSWISTKDLMYGEASELNQTALAMDNTEAADVLVGRRPARRRASSCWRTAGRRSSGSPASRRPRSTKGSTRSLSRSIDSSPTRSSDRSVLRCGKA